MKLAFALISGLFLFSAVMALTGCATVYKCVTTNLHACGFN